MQKTIGTRIVLAAAFFWLGLSACDGTDPNNGGICFGYSQCEASEICVDGSCVSPYGRELRFAHIKVVVSETNPNDEAWDMPGGMPDLYVCIWEAKTEDEYFCTTTRDDRLTAEWYETLDVVLHEDDEWFFEVFDEDPADNDSIGRCSSPITVDIIRGRILTCDNDYYDLEVELATTFY